MTRHKFWKRNNWTTISWSGTAYCIIPTKQTINKINPLYIDIPYNDKFRYNDNLNVTKPSLKRWQLMRNYARILYQIFKQHMFWIFVRIALISKTYVLWWKTNKTGSFLRIILLIKKSLQQHTRFNGNIFRNKCCRCKEDSLYLTQFGWPRAICKRGLYFNKCNEQESRNYFLPENFLILKSVIWSNLHFLHKTQEFL